MSTAFTYRARSSCRGRRDPIGTSSRGLAFSARGCFCSRRCLHGDLLGARLSGAGCWERCLERWPVRHPEQGPAGHPEERRDEGSLSRQGFKSLKNGNSSTQRRRGELRDAEGLNYSRSFRIKTWRTLFPPQSSASLRSSASSSSRGCLSRSFQKPIRRFELPWRESDPSVASLPQDDTLSFAPSG